MMTLSEFRDALHMCGPKSHIRFADRELVPGGFRSVHMLPDTIGLVSRIAYTDHIVYPHPFVEHIIEHTNLAYGGTFESEEGLFVAHEGTRVVAITNGLVWSLGGIIQMSLTMGKDPVVEAVILTNLLWR